MEGLFEKIGLLKNQAVNFLITQQISLQRTPKGSAFIIKTSAMPPLPLYSAQIRAQQTIALQTELQRPNPL